jgi:UDP-2,3-diacylglucosamine hydrolase
MKTEKISVKENSVFIADVHYKKGYEGFLKLLKEWLENPPPQIFFLGDIFHLLLPFEYLIRYNQEAIDLINRLSEKTEVFYTPGNHDFNVEGIFPKVKVKDAFVDEEKSIFLTHGDLTDDDLLYKIYVKIIRNRLGNEMLNVLSLNFINNWLFKKILNKKIKCNEIVSFKEKVFSKIADINYRIIIEGHYHQNVSFDFGDKKYINLGAYACDKSYYLFKNNSLKEKIHER